MPKIKNKRSEDYDFTSPIQISIKGRNLPYMELDLKPVMPKEESELEKSTKPYEFGKLPQTVAVDRVATFRAGKTVVKVAKKVMKLDPNNTTKVEPIIVSKQSLAYDQDMTILAWGEQKGFKAKKR